MSSLVTRVGLAALALSLVAVCVGGFLIHWTISDPGLRRRMIREFEASSGLQVEATGPMTLVLLPRPSIQLRDVVMTGADGGIALDSTAVATRLSLAGLLAGQVRVIKTTLDEPTVMMDLDRLMPLIQRLSQPLGEASAASGPLATLLRSDGLAIRSGTLRLVSRNPDLDTLLTNVTATWAWPPGEAAASLSGEATWHGEHGAFTAMLDAPQALLDRTLSPGFLRVKSPTLDLTIEGTLGSGNDNRSMGKISASSPTLPFFLRRIGMPFPALDGISQAKLNAEWSLADGWLALENTRLELDDMLFEGALAFGQRAGHPCITGTLATDRIDLDPFLSALPDPQAPDGAWSSALIETKAMAYDDVDLRISASRARMGRLEFEDGGLSLQSGSGRMELSLGEARAYDGLVKGRVVAQVDGASTDVRVEANVSQLNLASFAKKIDLGDQLTGTSTAHLTLDASGATPKSLMDSAAGWVEVSIRNGEIGPGLIARIIHPRSAPSDVSVSVRPRDVLPFDSTTLGFDIKQGVGTLATGWIAQESLRADLHGTASLPAQTLDVTAALMPVSDESGVDPAVRASMRLFGPWRDLRLDVLPADANAGPPGQ